MHDELSNMNYTMHYQFCIIHYSATPNSVALLLPVILTFTVSPM